LNKTDLSQALAEKSAEFFIENLDYMGSSKLSLIKAIVANGGFLNYDEALDFLAYEEDFYHLALEDFIFAGYDSEDFITTIAVLPQELYQLLKDMDLDSYKLNAKRNDVWINLASGMTHAYGIIDLQEMRRQLSRVLHKDIDMLKLMKVLEGAQNYCFNFVNEFGYYVYIGVDDTKTLIAEQASRHSIKYKEFTKAEFLHYADKDYYQVSPESKVFESFLLENYPFTKEMTKEFIGMFSHLIMEGEPVQNVLKELTQMIEIPDDFELQSVTKMFIDFYHASPQWFLKGNTPNELSSKAAPPLKSLLSVDNVNKKNVIINGNKADIIDMKTKKKIGRNDLCPCGSGKKYKHCCGK
jgi:hypothetical protein